MDAVSNKPNDAKAGLSRERIITGILQPYADRPGAALDTEEASNPDLSRDQRRIAEARSVIGQ